MILHACYCLSHDERAYVYAYYMYTAIHLYVYIRMVGPLEEEEHPRLRLARSGQRAHRVVGRGRRRRAVRGRAAAAAATAQDCACPRSLRCE